MYEFVRLSYIMGNINDEQVEGFANKGFISPKQAVEILSAKHS